MKYGKVCLFNKLWQCSFEGAEVDGNLCQACVAMAVAFAQRLQLISHLMLTFQDEEKAKEAFEKILSCAREWK